MLSNLPKITQLVGDRGEIQSRACVWTRDPWVPQPLPGIIGRKWKLGQPSLQVDAAAGRSVSDDLAVAAASDERKREAWAGAGGRRGSLSLHKC